MYQNIYVEYRYSDTPTVHLWDDNEGYNRFNFKNYAYINSENGDYESLYGDTLRKVPVSYLTRDRKDELKNYYGETRATFESDLPIETRVLIDMYSHSEEISENHIQLFFDIEVSSVGGYPDIEIADKEITSIAYYDRNTEHSAVLVLDPSNKLNTISKNDVEVLPFDTEEELLHEFLNHWEKIEPTIITGWNTEGFDIPYLYRRLKKIVGKDQANRLSPIGIVDYSSRIDRYTIAGVNSLDYIDLYKKFTFTQLSSYSLDNVSKVELDRGKVEYVGVEVEYEGETKVIRNLDDLMEYDIDRFIEYNLEDVWLVRDLDNKYNFIELAQRICHLGRVPYENIYKSSRYIDGAIITELNKKGIIAPDVKRITNFKIKDFHSLGTEEIRLENEIHEDIPKKGTIGISTSSSTTKKIDYHSVEGNKFILSKPLEFEVDPEYPIKLEFEGAFVKEPRAGLYEWIYDLDLTSMYPSIIMSLNISPETKVGKVYGWDAEEFVNDKENSLTYDIWTFHDSTMRTLDRDELHKFLSKHEFSIAANGAFYRNDIHGIIPEILEKWFTTRQKYKKLRGKSYDDGNPELAEYYDKLQHVYKILINSVYGVLGLTVFRFYDIDNAGAVTDTGRMLIQFTSKMGDHYYSKKIGEDKVWCLYTDTDSVIGSSKIHTDKYGETTISELYEHIADEETTKTIIKDSREYLFPSLLKSPYYMQPSSSVNMGHIDYIEKHAVDKDLYRIETENGKSVVVTEDHAVMVLEKGRLVEKTPLEILPGDKVVSISS